jgi:hypothetical protein
MRRPAAVTIRVGTDSAGVKPLRERVQRGGKSITERLRVGAAVGKHVASELGSRPHGEKKQENRSARPFVRKLLLCPFLGVSEKYRSSIVYETVGSGRSDPLRFFFGVDMGVYKNQALSHGQILPSVALPPLSW